MSTRFDGMSVGDANPDSASASASVATVRSADVGVGTGKGAGDSAAASAPVATVSDGFSVLTVRHVHHWVNCGMVECIQASAHTMTNP
jgi:hypothetical protein